MHQFITRVTFVTSIMSHRCWLLSPISQSLSDFPSRAAWPPAWSPGQGHRLDNNNKIITFWAEMACVGRKQVVSGVLLANIFSLEAGKLSLRYSQQYWLLLVTLAHSFMICLTSRLNIDIRAAHYFMVTAHWGTFVVMHTAGVWLRMLSKESNRRLWPLNVFIRRARPGHHPIRHLIIPHLTPWDIGGFRKWLTSTIRM